MTTSPIAEPRIGSAIAFDPLSRDHMQDPYPVYRRMREEEPAHYNAERDFWSLTRYDDVVAAFRDVKRFISSGGVTIDRFGANLPYLITSDPPRHSWHKALATRLFSAGRMAKLEQFVRTRSIELLEGVRGRDEIDVFEEVTVRLPLDVISELIDIPPDYREEMHRLTALGLRRGEGVDLQAVRDSFVQRRAIYLDLLKERRTRPRDDIITAMMNQESIDEDGAAHRLSDEEIAYHFSELTSAGHETVAKAIPNALLALDAFPGERAKLAADRSRMADAVEEMLRWDTPTQMQGRTAACDIAIHGKTIREGDVVMLINASATRDDAAFPEADRLDFDRKLDPRAVHFGFGIHKCLGIHLARVEVRIALEELFARYPDHKVHRERARRDIVVNVRGVSGLPMTLGAHA